MNPIQLFQKTNGLVADGIIGRQTILKMAEVWRKSVIQICHFLGQTNHESAAFQKLVENLNYSAQGLANTWPRRYSVNPDARVKTPNRLADSLARNPVAIANNVYANRMGNGDEASGDGWKHRGRGFLMVTGKENQGEFAAWIGDAKVSKNPDLISEKYALESALFFFSKNNVWSAANAMTDKSIRNVSLLVNGGEIGLEERNRLTKKYYQIATKKP